MFNSFQRVCTTDSVVSLLILNLWILWQEQLIAGDRWASSLRLSEHCETVHRQIFDFILAWLIRMTIDRLASSFGVSTVSRDLRRNASEKRLSSRKFLPIIEDCADQHSGDEKRRQTSFGEETAFANSEVLCSQRLPRTTPSSTRSVPRITRNSFAKCQRLPSWRQSVSEVCFGSLPVYRLLQHEMERRRFWY